MGKERKRAHEHDDSRSRRKRRRTDREHRRPRRARSSSPVEAWEPYPDPECEQSRNTPTPSLDVSPPPSRYWSESEDEASSTDESHPRSEVCNNNDVIIDLDKVEPHADTAALPKDILEALGDPKGREEVFGPPIPEELARRWETILKDGLTKENKQEIVEKTLIPDNFRLAKAPLLNDEIAPVLSESVRNRDKLLERSQNLLGLGISKLTQLTASIITSNNAINKIDMVKNLSEVSQILLELHHDETVSRRKLIIASLDKKFTATIKDVKRDAYLFGANLGNKIKALKSAEKSGLQIKRQDGSANPRRNQGNWRGSSRSSGPGQRGRKSNQRGRQSNSYQSQRPGAANSRQHRGGGGGRKPSPNDKPDKS